MSVISGTAYWASITSPNTTFDADGTWSIDVGNLDADNKALAEKDGLAIKNKGCLLYTSPSPRDGLLSRMPSSA